MTRTKVINLFCILQVHLKFNPKGTEDNKGAFTTILSRRKNRHLHGKTQNYKKTNKGLHIILQTTNDLAIGTHL